MSKFREIIIEKFGAEVLDSDRFQDRFDEVLNESHSTVEVAGIEFEPARVLKELDEIAYNEHYSAWLDTEETEGNIYNIEHDVYLTKDEYNELMDEIESE